jgi:hypothetical protein
MLLSAGRLGGALLAFPGGGSFRDHRVALASLATDVEDNFIYSFVSAVMVFTSLIVSTVNATASPK